MAKEKKVRTKAVKKQRTEKKKGFGISIRTQLFVGFLIPMVLVVAVGAFAYQKASEGMLSNYQESAQTALQMTVKLLDYGFTTVDAASMQIFNDTNVKDYVSETYKNDIVERSNVYKQSQKLVDSTRNSNEFISDVMIVTADNLDDVSTSSPKGKKNGYYDSFKQESAAAIESKDKTESWLSGHPVVDERFHTSTDNYILSQYRLVSTKNACVVIDISSAKIKSILEDLKLGEGSIISFVTANDRELAMDSQSGFVFADKEYYTLAKNAEEGFYSDFVMMDGVEYLFMYGRCEANKSAVCSLTPKSALMQAATDIRNGIIVGVLLSSIVVLIVGLTIFTGISSKMGNIIKRLSKVSEGDLTVDMRIHDRAEFGKLSGHIMEVVSNTKELIGKVKDTSGQVSDCVGNVKAVGDELANSSVYVQGITDEIAEGVNTQAEDMQNCLYKMDSLSEKIIRTGDNVREMEKLADGTKEMIVKSTAGVNELSGQAAETGTIMNSLEEKMEVLNTSMQSIRELVNTIDTIAESTTLLSLNASIEAARAGEAGRGFAVVADEIKKLADSSKQSSEEITNMIDNLQVVFAETKEASNKAGDIVKVQENTVEDIKALFVQMSGNMEMLLNNINQSISDMNEMDDYRKDTLISFENISAVSEETAASTTTVSETMNNQSEHVDRLLVATTELEEKMTELVTAIERFTV
ncbi:MAG: methyl-accepting chemotaxis protein [Lachnospiraceae bacterium]|nr:methyl-accepting chemotaxis protein [Lachnospiraceae bacterium]